MTRPVNLLTGKTKSGTTVQEFNYGRQAYRLVCHCGAEYYDTQARICVQLVRNDRYLQCYGCSCKMKAANSKLFAARRRAARESVHR
ncbi:hypothetical protein D3C81_441870 [compost metagenome]